MCSPERVPVILDQYMSENVTELTVYLGFDNPDESFINGDHLCRFVDGFLNLLRLDMLGKAVLDIKIQLAHAFMDVMSYACLGGLGAPISTMLRCLALVLEVEERSPNPNYAVPEDYFYGADHQTALLHNQLDDLEALLLAHSAAGGARLYRLEICVTISRIVPQDMLKAKHYRIADVPPSSHWARQLSWLYMPPFQTLVDEVVFLGDSPRAQRVLRGAMRQITESKAKT